jgi:hypothetical protein
MGQKAGDPVIAKLAARLLVPAIVATTGFLSAGTLASAFAPAGDVLHLTVKASSSDTAAPRISEYWLDERRWLAKVVEATPDGSVTNETGPTWMIHVPARGAALKYETPVGAAATRTLFGSLYFMRDAYKAGAAKLIAGMPDSFVIQLGPRSAELERASGLPKWEVIDSVRIDYTYERREHLPSAAFPTDFFSDTGGRAVETRIETDPAGAAARVHFTLLTAGASALGRPLEATLVSFRADGPTLEQVGQKYGSDVQVSMSLLERQPTAFRPDAEFVTTALGPTRLYRDPGRVQLLQLDGRLATSVIAPDVDTALQIAALLRPVR